MGGGIRRLAPFPCQQILFDLNMAISSNSQYRLTSSRSFLADVPLLFSCFQCIFSLAQAYISSRFPAHVSRVRKRRRIPPLDLLVHRLRLSVNNVYPFSIYNFRFMPPPKHLPRSLCSYFQPLSWLTSRLISLVLLLLTAIDVMLGYVRVPRVPRPQVRVSCSARSLGQR